MAFGRSAPAQLVADAIESMIADLVDAVVGGFGLPLPDDEQLEAPWACTGCGRRQGFRRRGFRPKPRKVMTACGQVAFRSQQLGCGGCGRRFAPAAELLGLAPHQRRTERLSELAASLAVEEAYAKASRLLAELAGPSVLTRSIRRDVIATAPERIGPEVTEVPILLLDGTGERAGQTKGGVALHLAIGLVARRREGKRVCVEARLLGAAVGEGWDVMSELLAGLAPGPGPRRWRGGAVGPGRRTLRRRARAALPVAHGPGRLPGRPLSLPGQPRPVRQLPLPARGLALCRVRRPRSRRGQSGLCARHRRRRGLRGLGCGRAPAGPPKARSSPSSPTRPPAVSSSATSGTGVLERASCGR